MIKVIGMPNGGYLMARRGRLIKDLQVADNLAALFSNLPEDEVHFDRQAIVNMRDVVLHDGGYPDEEDIKSMFDPQEEGDDR